MAVNMVQRLEDFNSSRYTRQGDGVAMMQMLESLKVGVCGDHGLRE